MKNVYQSWGCHFRYQEQAVQIKRKKKVPRAGSSKCTSRSSFLFGWEAGVYIDWSTCGAYNALESTLESDSGHHEACMPTIMFSFNRHGKDITCDGLAVDMPSLLFRVLVSVSSLTSK